MAVDLGPLFAGFLVSSIGFVLFMYGKKMKRAPQMAVGVVLLVYPYFVTGVLLMLGIAVVLLFLLWLAIQRGL